MKTRAYRWKTPVGFFCIKKKDSLNFQAVFQERGEIYEKILVSK